MFTDDQTSRDLELFSAQHGGRSILDLIDFTSCHLGSRALRARFANPMTSSVEIRETQDAVRFLGASSIRLTLNERLVTQVERFLDSSYETLKTSTLRHVEAVWVAVRYRNTYQAVAEGVENTVRLLRLVRPVVRSLRGASPPAVLASVLDPMQRILDEFLGSGPGLHNPWSVLETDRLLRKQRADDLRTFLGLLGELDALFSMATSLGELDFCLPDVVSDEAFSLEVDALRHPFLKDPVTNPVSVAGGETLVFLTGPNMAGKTTYLKAVGIAMHLAHCGMGVPAAAMRFAPVDGLITSLRPEDNLREGLSFFLAEVRRVRKVAEWLASGRTAFVIFDEIFRGTNVQDALEASKTVILGFGRARSSGFVISSHLTELADDLRDQPVVRFAYFDGDIEKGVAHYTFKIRDGVSRKRFGLQLLEQEQVPSLLATIPLSA